MRANEIKAKVWVKPEMARIGKISDVAGSQTPSSQAAGNVKS